MVRDRRDNTFFVKFDPRAYPNLTTGADVISKNFFHVIGYNVPESLLVYLRPEHFAIDPGAEIDLPGGKKAPMDRMFLNFMLDNAAHQPDGSIRAVAGLMLPGELIGPFKFYGTRPDEPNDITPHQHRRELRGYRVFCAWLNHDDSRSINTLDSFVRNNGDRGHVVHYLIDFGSTLGSGSDHFRLIAPQDPRAGNEYFVELGPVWKTAYTFGIWERPWRKVKYPYPKYGEVGRIEADYFEPHKWKPEYPNPAFERMLTDDGFWAAKIVARFSDEAIRALVTAGEYLILATHGAVALLDSRILVEEAFEGKPVWTGEVLVFELKGHPTATQCYAWSVDGRVTAVLHKGPVDSPRAAVRAAIVAEHRSGS